MLEANNRYPKINLKSKNDLAKRISGKALPYNEALKLINIVIENFDKYWHNVNKMSEPEKNKFVRSCKNTPLEKLLNLINKNILAPYDCLIPEFIFGGVSGRSHVGAVVYLLGNQRKRSKLSLDIKRFFEQNSRERIFYFFNKKCQCSIKISNILADLCCVPFGDKGNTGNKTIARGFATSSRLALWCNMDLFMRIYWKTKNILKNKDARIAIFVDDIGITASRVDKKDLELLYDEVANIFSNPNSKHNLSIHDKNSKKTDFKNNTESGIEHLGLVIGKNKVSVGKKTRHKLNKIKKELSKENLTREDRKKLIIKKKSINNYLRYIKLENNKNNNS